MLDFADNQDTLIFDGALFDFEWVSTSEILSLARVASGNTVFRFAPGDSLTLLGFTDIPALANDVQLI